MTFTYSRLARMTYPEIAWRTRGAGRATLDRLRYRLAPERWDRSAVADALARDADLTPVGEALRRRDWLEAHAGLSRYFIRQPRRFPISPADRSARAGRITDGCPDAVQDAVKRADRVLNGDFDLLGYRGLRFHLPHAGNGAEGSAIDWLYDPVSHRRLPTGFSAAIDYLDPQGADHKVVWEVNRHQHWLALGRAFWLTGNRKYRDAFVDQLASWIASNPPLATANWSSMLELAFRALSWTWALSFFAVPDTANEPPWTVDLLMALDRQLTHIERNLSRYFSPNTHLLGEGLALYVTGRALPALEKSAARQRIGRRVLLDEIDRQIETDGGHSERSTHYHRYTLDFYLLALAVARLTEDDAAPAFAGAVGRLADAAVILADGQGRFPHIGDDDGGMLFPICGREVDDVRDSLAVAGALLGRQDLSNGDMPEEAYWLLADCIPARSSAALVAGSAVLPATGYYVSRSAAGDHLLIDAGPHGFRNGGHAHADALSLTLTVRGVPLLIDPGTGCYTIDVAARNRFRSTFAHNTVVVDDRPQSVPAGPFHWTTTADARARFWQVGRHADYFEGTHDGYNPVEHRRHILAVRGDLVLVLDLVAGPGTHCSAVLWHIDPQWSVEVVGRRATFRRPQPEDTAEKTGPFQLMVSEGVLEKFIGDSSGLGWWSPAYGRIEPSPTLRIQRDGPSPVWIASVFGLDPDNAIVDVEHVPVWAEAGTLANAAGLRVTRAHSIEHFLVAECAALHDGRTWRLGEIETNARMFFARVEGGRVTLADMAEGTVAELAGHPELAGILRGGSGSSSAGRDFTRAGFGRT